MSLAHRIEGQGDDDAWHEDGVAGKRYRYDFS